MKDNSKKEIKWFQRKLWDQMESFDAFDPVIHTIDYLISQLTPELARELNRHYGLKELALQCRHYAQMCMSIAKRIDDLLAKKKEG